MKKDFELFINNYRLVDNFIAKSCYIDLMSEGVLKDSFLLQLNDNRVYKYCVILEHYLNANSSNQKLIFTNSEELYNYYYDLFTEWNNEEEFHSILSNY